MSASPPDRPLDAPDDVDPEIRLFHQRTNADYGALSSGAGGDLAARRKVAEKVREAWSAGGPRMASTENLAVGRDGVGIRIHLPTIGAALPVLVYIHGGGWTLFSNDTHDRLMREYAARAGVAVLGIEYSLSPETRFPGALDEIADVLGWLRAEGPAHGLDPDRVAFGGDSAGANLALAAALRLRGGGEGPIALLLNYGAFDTEVRGSHHRYDGDAYMLTTAEMADFWANYLGEGAQTGDPLARPLLADLAGLPPTFLCIAECDILADENREMAARLEAAGIAVDARVYRGATHSFLEAVSISALADRALAEASAWLAARLGA